ncbi:MAG: D-sedoheptulose 7-phosphate isomerase [Chlorobi bacterium]|nr:D-sedoheptulose 7-phosphate isomerase [Chlorobiota bacterium]
MTESPRETIERSLNDAAEGLARLRGEPALLDAIQRFAGAVVKAFSSGGKVLACGNGGSMSDAMHFAEEFSGRYRKDRKPLPALALNDPAHITCTANDYGFEYVFSRQVEALGKQGDVLLAISTSGNSPNVINAVVEAKKHGMVSVGLLGKGGGRLAELVDLPVIVPGETADRIQELHIKILHIVIEIVERNLVPENYEDS